LWLTFRGRSVHASVPEKGENPNYALATFLQRLQATQGELSRHPILGQTTVAPTIIEVDTKSPNVTPAWTRVLLDFRTASETTTSLKAFIRRVAGDLSYELRHGWEPDNPVEDNNEVITGFVTEPESEMVRRVRSLLAQGMGRQPALTSYQFATDGRHFVPYGLPILGYSPADEAQAHIAGESISIGRMAESLRGHIALLEAF
jgi:acetylornithine deacetylase/succinyl-diaminopimelate desuccinylase-like protein